MGKCSVAETVESIYGDLKTVIFKDLNIEDMLSNNALVRKTLKRFEKKMNTFGETFCQEESPLVPQVLPVAIRIT